jgi:predicted SAM-dependent methyltransferase
MAKQYLKKHTRLLGLAETTRRVLFRYLYAIRHRKMIKNYFRSHQTRKLQIGAGRNALKGWLNTDRDTALSKETVFMDARKKLPFDVSTFDYIFCEHFIEHLDYRDGLRFVHECYRVLKLGGTLRISTPDLSFLIELFTENKTELQQRYIRWAVDSHTDFGIYIDTFVINNFFRSWGHKFIYDYKTLKDLMTRCGFADIRTYNPGESDDKNLEGLESHDREIGKEFNKLESLILEGTKFAGI